MPPAPGRFAKEGTLIRAGMRKKKDSEQTKPKYKGPMEPAEAELVEPDEIEPEVLEESVAEIGEWDPVVSSPTSGTPVPYDALQHYLAEIRNHPLLSRDEEVLLARRFQEEGDRGAAAALVTSNLRLVVKIAMEHQRYWTRNLLDLIQEGNMGLVQAVRKFDPFRGIKFSYYASFWIKAYILKFIMDNWRLVKVGTTQAQRKLFYNLSREKDKLLAQGITPRPKLLSTRLGVSEDQVVEMEQRLDGWELSLDSPVREDGDDSHGNFLPDEGPNAEESLASDELKGLFHRKLMEFRKTLDEKEKDIMDLRLLAEAPMTLNDLGDKHGISRERVRQIQVRLMDNLRDYLKENIPDFEGQFLDLPETD